MGYEETAEERAYRQERDEIAADPSWTGTGQTTMPMPPPNGLVISDDGRLLNWQGVNYIMQETVPSDMSDRELLIELVTLARGAVADMAEFSSKIAGNSILSKIFGVKSDKG